MAKKWGEHPAWQRWAAYIGGGFLALVLLGIAFPESDESRAAREEKERAEAAAVQETQSQAQIAFAGRVERRLNACIGSLVALSDLGDTMDRADGYAAARAADETCTAAWMGMNDDEVPDGLPKAAEDDCGLALFTFSQAAEKAAELLDRGSLETQYEMRQEMEAGRQLTLSCRAALPSLAGEVSE